MAYDDLKEFNGKGYTGMPVGGQHSWIYPDGRWRERKVAPDRWEFTFESIKERERAAPMGSGAPPNTQYHWYILAHQRVRKIDEDSYHTFMSGVKYKVAHKRPHWRRWSCEYPDQASERDRIMAILEATLASLRGEARSDVELDPSEPPQMGLPTQMPSGRGWGAQTMQAPRTDGLHRSPGGQDL